MAQERAILPVEDWLKQAQLLSRGERTKLDNSLNIVLGKQLYDAVFQGTLRESWSQAQAIAQKQQEVLRLRLGITGNRLAKLPWEIMHTGDRYLITDPCIAFSRYRADVESGLHRGTVPESVGLKVLMATAAPTAQTNLALKPLVDLQFTVLNQPEPQQLTVALEQGGYQILHYVGRIYLVIGRTGLPVTLSQDELADLFVADEVQTAVFNSGDESIDLSGNLTQSLLQRGIDFVLTVETPLSDRIALTLTQLFYRYLSQGYPVDLSLSCARLGLISAYGADDLSWALPILYLQPEFDGYLEVAAVELLEEDWIDQEEEDIFYEQDAAIVSELFCQLATQRACAAPLELTPIATQPTIKALGGCEQPPIKPFRAWMVSGVVGVSAIALLVVCFDWKRASKTFSIPAESVRHQIKHGYFLKHPSDRH